MIRVLVAGAGGQLGREFAAPATTSGDVEIIASTLRDLDITDREAVSRAVGECEPDVVLNCAAWTAVDACEADPARADLVNGQAVEHLVNAAASVGAHLIQMSTDYVFSGRHPRGDEGEWSSLDQPDPGTAYGRSKLIGEKAAAGHTIVRTSWLSGVHGSNVVKALLTRLSDPDAPIAFVDDQRGKPTFTADLVGPLLHFCRTKPTGIFHATNERAVTWYQFAREIAAAGGHDPDRVQPISTRQLEPRRAANRPANSALANSAPAALGRSEPTRDFSEPLAELVTRLQPPTP